jgi:hypothetical protein
VLPRRISIEEPTCGVPAVNTCVFVTTAHVGADASAPAAAMTQNCVDRPGARLDIRHFP